MSFRGWVQFVRSPYAVTQLIPGPHSQATQTATAGFGYISTATTFSPPRQGSFVARFQF
ncbi:MAG TPA: hypothetical protein VN841_22710 [Bryobacteraceae bacterium]|nr:hypothetical protein [Bryobacteraceae bacterium]